jgi:hypothetical protein
MTHRTLTGLGRMWRVHRATGAAPALANAPSHADAWAGRVDQFRGHAVVTAWQKDGAGFSAIASLTIFF